VLEGLASQKLFLAILGLEAGLQVGVWGGGGGLAGLCRAGQRDLRAQAQGGL
jgi:hypothetical protein